MKATSLHRHYPAHGFSVDEGASPTGLPVLHPLHNWAVQDAGSLPCVSRGAAPALIESFETCSAFTRVTACPLAEPPDGGHFPPRCYSRFRYNHELLRLLPAITNNLHGCSTPAGRPCPGTDDKVKFPEYRHAKPYRSNWKCLRAEYHVKIIVLR